MINLRLPVIVGGKSVTRFLTHLKMYKALTDEIEHE